MSVKVKFQVIQGAEAGFYRLAEERLLDTFDTEAEAEELAARIPGDLMGSVFRYVRKVWVNE